jgi:hypothetical protein
MDFLDITLRAPCPVTFVDYFTEVENQDTTKKYLCGEKWVLIL